MCGEGSHRSTSVCKAVLGSMPATLSRHAQSRSSTFTTSALFAHREFRRLPHTATFSSSKTYCPRLKAVALQTHSRAGRRLNILCQLVHYGPHLKLMPFTHSSCGSVEVQTTCVSHTAHVGQWKYRPPACRRTSTLRTSVQQNSRFLEELSAWLT